MSSFGIELHKRSEDKSALMEAWMRNCQRRFIEDAVIVQQEIQVERPGSLAIFRIAPQGPLDLPANLQQAFRRDICFDLYDAIQEPCGTRGGAIMYRLCFIE